MTGFFNMVKTNLKLVLRNKSSIFLLFLVPVFATLILKIPVNQDGYEDTFKIGIEVYDNSHSEASDILISLLKENSTLNVKVYDGEDITLKEAEELSLKKANRNTIKNYLYISPDFSQDILDGNQENAMVFITNNKDSRVEMIKNNLSSYLNMFSTAAQLSQGNETVLSDILRTMMDKKINGSVEYTDSKSTETRLQKNQTAVFGNFLALLTVTLLFSSNIVGSIFIHEKDNNVFNRIKLSKTTMVSYALSKIVITVIVLIIQIAMIALGIKIFGGTNSGLSILQVSIILFGVGLVFSFLTITMCCMMKNLSTINYGIYFIAVISSIVSGLYFPLEMTPQWTQKLSLIAPQRLALLATSGIHTGTFSNLHLFYGVVAAYVAVLLSISCISLGRRKSQS